VDANRDEYQSHTPSLSVAYWLTNQYGLTFNGYHKNTEYDLSDDTTKSWSGNVRFLKRATRYLDLYVSYAYTYTDRTTGNQTISNPSVGVDWQVTQDSGISIGCGLLFQEWDNQNSTESKDLFLDVDVYKDIRINPRSTFSITGATGYSETKPKAESLSFNIYYRAGVLLTNQLTRSLAVDLSGSGTYAQFDDPLVDRNDFLLTFGVGLDWIPLRWLSLNLAYSYNDYKTDDQGRDDYQEKVIRIAATFTPTTPLRGRVPDTRTQTETRIFGTERSHH